jgi:hypothetical protein
VQNPVICTVTGVTKNIRQFGKRKWEGRLKRVIQNRRKAKRNRALNAESEESAETLREFSRISHFQFVMKSRRNVSYEDEVVCIHLPNYEIIQSKFGILKLPSLLWKKKESR